MKKLLLTILVLISLSAAAGEKAAATFAVGVGGVASNFGNHYIGSTFTRFDTAKSALRNSLNKGKLSKDTYQKALKLISSEEKLHNLTFKSLRFLGRVFMIAGLSDLSRMFWSATLIKTDYFQDSVIPYYSQVIENRANDLKNIFGNDRDAGKEVEAVHTNIGYDAFTGATRD